MMARIWHGATRASKSDDYLTLMRTVAIPDYRSTPGNRGAYALRRIDGDTAHFLCSRSGNLRRQSVPSPETTLARRNTMTSTKISCSNWSHAPHITRCTTVNPQIQFRVVSVNACLRQLCV